MEIPAKIFRLPLVLKRILVLFLLVYCVTILLSCNTSNSKVENSTDQKIFTITKVDLSGTNERKIDSTVVFFNIEKNRADSIQYYGWVQNFKWEKNLNLEPKKINTYLSEASTNDLYKDPFGILLLVNANCSLQDFESLRLVSDSMITEQNQNFITTHLTFNRVSQNVLLNHSTSTDTSITPIDIDKAIFTTKDKKLKKVEYFFNDNTVEVKLIETRTTGCIEIISLVKSHSEVIDNKVYKVNLIEYRDGKPLINILRNNYIIGDVVGKN
jgi:hypothetical protein